MSVAFNTTKGALVRSMLYPRPIGFKFYRDSVRFIGVLAGIAVLGFCYSAVQFVRLAVSISIAGRIYHLIYPIRLPGMSLSFALSILSRLSFHPHYRQPYPSAPVSL